MGIKPAKVSHRPWWPSKRAKAGLSPETEDLFAKKKGLRSAGAGPKLLKWGLPGRGLKSAKVRHTPYAYYRGVARDVERGRTFFSPLPPRAPPAPPPEGGVGAGGGGSAGLEARAASAGARG